MIITGMAHFESVCKRNWLTGITRTSREWKLDLSNCLCGVGL